MNPQEAMNALLVHTDPDVRAAAVILKHRDERRTRILNLVQEALAQLRLDIKYLAFDLDCTRKERDALKGGE